MKIQTKLLFNNMKINIKRTIFTTISIALCTFLILTTLLVISSIRNGINENIDTQYNDYHFIIKDLDIDSFNKIKDKEYINKIYVQENDEEPLKELDKTSNPFNNNINVNIYIKYDNIKQTYKYSTDIIQTLGFSFTDVETKCEFNDKLLTVYGLMGADLDYADTSKNTLIYRSVLNLSYAIDIMIILILLSFSIFFIIILYNAFLITINERKKEYAILNSIGATEGQILKMVFKEASIIGIFGIIIGALLSVFGTNIILDMLNNILSTTTYSFKLAFSMQYIILALIIILFNIYISAIIPSIRASTVSIIEDLRNNKQIKYKKRNSILEKMLPIEGKLGLINLKRNKNKYRVITILLVICMTSYIAVSTYINYEKETSNLATDYDVDAVLTFNKSNTDYKSVLNNYVTTSGDEIDYIEYKMMGVTVLVEPESAIETNNIATTYKNNKKSIPIALVGLENKIYIDNINKLNANYGDYIIYNNIIMNEGEDELTYKYNQVFNSNNLNLSIIDGSVSYLEKDELEYKIIDNENLKREFVLSNDLIEGFKEFRNQFRVPIVFVNMNSYNKIEENLNNYISQNKDHIVTWMSFADMDDTIHVKVKCKNVIKFSDYIEDVKKEQNIEISANYYSLDNQEKIIYINILQLILKIVIFTIIVIGVISTINIINANLCEREQEFKVLSNIGATNENINMVLLYECFYIFIKATIISIILSIPIIYAIIKYIEKIIKLNELLIPFSSIGIFVILLFIISLFITLISTKFIKNK